MAKELIGQPNEWAHRFYRLIEDFEYSLIDVATLRQRLTEMDLERITIEDLIDCMTNPPPIDYTAS